MEDSRRTVSFLAQSPTFQGEKRLAKANDKVLKSREFVDGQTEVDRFS